MAKLERLRAELAGGERPVRVDLSGDGLTHFPQELFELAPDLEFLNLGANELTDLPLDIERFVSLKILFFEANKFEVVPKQLGRLPRLRMLSFKSNAVRFVCEECLAPSIEWLILTDNKIPTLPESIGKLKGLRKLLLAGNQLSTLPDSMSNCTELELVRLSSNRLPGLPQWIFSLPRLTWIAFAGNAVDFSPGGGGVGQAQAVAWSQLTVLELLGEGASGNVYRVKASGISWSEEEKDYALKVFRGEVTSDGLAEDEIKVNEFVGNHPSFVPVLGRIVDHPQGLPALLLPLLATDRFSILGGPPSFDSITRDTFASSTAYSLPFICQVLRDVACGVRHLAALQIMHGDLYAHNILTDAQGHALLTDFGAASFYQCAAGDAALLERIEVRAFGCLMEDLLARLVLAPADDVSVVAALQGLMEQCLAEQLSARPTFEVIGAALPQL